jgi:hypothetical protein
MNCTPLSEKTTAGMPYLATQPAMKASAQSAAAVALRGKASTHLVDLSITVRRCEKPSGEQGRGPTMSKCTWEKRALGIWMGWTAAAGCLVTLAP